MEACHHPSACLRYRPQAVWQPTGPLGKGSLQQRRPRQYSNPRLFRFRNYLTAHPLIQHACGQLQHLDFASSNRRQRRSGSIYRCAQKTHLAIAARPLQAVHKWPVRQNLQRGIVDLNHIQNFPPQGPPAPIDGSVHHARHFRRRHRVHAFGYRNLGCKNAVRIPDESLAEYFLTRAVPRSCVEKIDPVIRSRAQRHRRLDRVYGIFARSWNPVVLQPKRSCSQTNPRNPQSTSPKFGELHNVKDANNSKQDCCNHTELHRRERAMSAGKVSSSSYILPTASSNGGLDRLSWHSAPRPFPLPSPHRSHPHPSSPETSAG